MAVDRFGDGRRKINEANTCLRTLNFELQSLAQFEHDMRSCLIRDADKGITLAGGSVLKRTRTELAKKRLKEISQE